MSNGMNVKCSRCGNGYNVYEPVGVCPTCNNVEGFKFEHPFTFEYNSGGKWMHRIDGELQEVTPENIHKVDPKYHPKKEHMTDDCKIKPHLDELDADNFDARITIDELEREPASYAAFDQDYDFIAANLGWD